jgi:hypothetical protein
VFSSHKEGPTGGSLMRPSCKEPVQQVLFGRNLSLYRQMRLPKALARQLPAFQPLNLYGGTHLQNRRERGSGRGKETIPVYLPPGRRVSKIINKAGSDQPFGFFLLVPLCCQLRRAAAQLNYHVLAIAILNLRRQPVPVLALTNFTV